MKPTPDEEPDYTRERAEFANSAYQDRLRQAQDYNSSVQDYNSQLNNYLGSYNDLLGQVNGLTIRDADRFGNFSSSIGDLQRQVTGASFTREAPFFESMVQSPYGAVQVGIPTLTEVNSRAQNTLSSGIEGLSGRLNQLRNERQTEEGRIRDFRSGLLGQLSTINSGVSSAGIGNKSALDALRSQLDAINTQRNTFSSSILDQMYPQGFTQIGAQYDLARGALDDLYSRRAAEQDRINRYDSGLQSAYDSFNDRFGGLSIADEAGLNSLKNAIDAKQLDASRFKSDLSFDFGGELGQIQSLEDRLDRMISERGSELSRIEQAKNSARQATYSLDEQMGNANIYDLSRLDGLRRAIDQGRRDITGFTSKLPFDFGDTLSQFDSADQTLQQLLAQRSSRLGQYQTDLDEILAGVSGAELYDESAFRDAITAAQALGGQVGRFSGRDVLDLGFGIEDAVRSANSRLKELGEYRTGIENRAQAALDAAKAGGFYSLDDFAPHQSALDALMEEMGLYGATAASDELSALEALLGSEHSRLSQDLVNSSQSSALAQSDVARMLAQQNGGSPMTVEQYMLLLQQLEDEEENPANDNLFSRNLGVIRL